MDSDELTLRDYAVIVRRRKWWIIVPVVLITAAAVAFSFTQNDRYRASADVLVQDPASATTVDKLGTVVSSRLINNELQRAKGSALQDLARESIGEEPELSVKLAAANDVDVLVFSATSRSAAGAADAANSYAQTYVEVRRKALVDELAARSVVLQSRLDDVTQELGTASGSTATVLLAQQDQYQRELETLTASTSFANSSGASVIDAAQAPTVPYSPNPKRDGALALVIGILVGLGLAFLVDYRDTSLHDEEGLADASGLSVLAVIPQLKKWGKKDHPHLISLEAPFSASGEAYRGLRTSLQFLGIEHNLKVLEVTSPKPGDGKTTIAANLAVVHAIAGQKVVLVDWDLRKPRIHEFFDLSNDVGFTTVVSQASLDDVLQVVPDVANLRVVTSGPIPPDPSEILGKEVTAKFIAWLGGQFDLIIIDTPPVLAVPDPLIVSGLADGVLLVASAHSTDLRQVTKASEQLSQVDAPILGAVLNALDIEKESDYQYRYSYGDYKAEPAE